MPDEGNDTPGKFSQSSNSTTRREFIEIGLKGITLLPYVAPLIETYLIEDAHANGDDGDGKGKGGCKISPPPYKGKGSNLKLTNADELSGH